MLSKAKLLAMRILGGGAVPTYNERLESLFASSLISRWKLDEAAGTAAVNTGTIGTAGNGTYSASGITLANAAAPSGIGGLAPLFDGTAGFVNIHSAALVSAFSGAAGTFGIWAKVSAAADWTDATIRYHFFLRADDNNRIGGRKSSTSHRMYYLDVLGGTVDAEEYTKTPTGSLAWVFISVTWSKAADEIKHYVNGVQFGATQTGVGTWSGNLNAASTLIGALTATPTNTWKGWLSNAMLLNRVATPAELRTVSNAGVPRTHISVIGDSIAAAAGSIGWADLLNAYNSGNSYHVINHAVSGHSIMANMDADVVLAVNNNADKIILALGTNDNNAGDMTALQAEVEENIAELKISNPNATIYYMNVLPRSTDKALIRAAIAAACAAQSITCWDTVTTPWIDYATETSDGLHPNAAGAAKILTQVLARI